MSFASLHCEIDECIAIDSLCTRSVMERGRMNSQLLMLLFVALVMLSGVSSSFNITLYPTLNGSDTSWYEWNSTVSVNSSFDDNNGTTSVPTTAEPSVTSFWQYHAAQRWFKIASPFLIVLATVGNTFSVVTLQNPMFPYANPTHTD